jgi:hypothetical protein
MQYDQIRCYHREEVPAALERLTQQKQFMNVVSTVYPLMPKDVLKQRLLSFDNTNDFQRIMVYPFLQYIEANLTKGIVLEGLESIDRQSPYLYISNHRDIILDSALFCGKLIEQGIDTVEIAIGDNLLIFPWIEDLVRMNKSFIVRRSPGAKQMLTASSELSHYIKHTIIEKKQSVWIAQREGRAKDSDDKTQESLLKMFNMGGSGPFAQNIADLRICPLSISYEYDPCDYLKAKEFQQKRDNPEYKKSPTDDLLNMKTGVMGYKGRVVYRMMGEIGREVLALGDIHSRKNDLISAIAQLIDRKIYQGYEIYNINLIAHDLLEGNNRFTDRYSLMEKLDFEKYLAGQIDKIDLPDKDYDFLMEKLLQMYANPLVNHLKSQEG